MDRHSGHRRAAILIATAAVSLATAASVPLLTSAHATGGGVSGAVDTTNQSGEQVNGNIYDTKDEVYLDGGSNAPAAQHLAEGDYFFAVLDPGGQQDPNDSNTTSNLSVGFDSAGARSFHANADGSVSPTGESTHTFVPDGGPGTVQLADFANTSNPGGEYIVAVCPFVSDGAGGADSVDPKDCKYDAFKVKESIQPPPPNCQDTNSCPVPIAAPTGSKTATPEHDRDVTWAITKTVSPTSFQQLTAGTATYTVKVTKTLVSESWSIAGSISVFNTNAGALPVIVADDGLVDITTPGNAVASLCTVTPPATDSTGMQFADGSASGTVPGGSDVSPGEEDFTYSCTLDNPGTDSYENTAQIGYTDDQNQPQTVPTDPSASFDFSTVTQQGDPESVLVTDTYTGPGSPSDASTHPNGTVVSDSMTWQYTRTFFNSNCQTYSNTATVAAQVGDTVLTDPPDLPASAEADVTFCGPNNGGLTMGWWQNKNGQALLKANLTNTGGACPTLNGYVGTHTGASDLINASSKTTGTYVPGDCSTSTKSSYLPTFAGKVFTAANAAGTGLPMELGQWLTTTLDVASYPTFTSAGRPTLQASQTVTNPAGLFGLPSCTSIGSLLSGAVNTIGSYATTKSVVTAAITEFNNINNNQQQTC